MLDKTLTKFFDNPIRTEEFYSWDLPFVERDETIKFLLTEGYLEQNAQSFKITFKGRMRVTDKTFVQEAVQRRIINITTLLAAIATIISAIYYFLSQI